MSATYSITVVQGEMIICPHCDKHLGTTASMIPRPPGHKGPWNVIFCPACDSELNIEITTFNPRPEKLCVFCLRASAGEPMHSKLTRNQILERFK